MKHDLQRLTTQRRRVLEAVAAARGRHPSAIEVCRTVNRRRPEVHLATVYRALQYLAGRGLVTRTSLGQNHAHYQAAGRDAVHLVCSSCGDVREVCGQRPLRLLPSLDRALPKAFRVDSWQLQVTGLCGKCLRLPRTADERG